MLKRNREKLVFGMSLLVLIVSLSFYASAKTAEVSKITFWTWGHTSVFDKVWEQFIHDYPQYKNIQYVSQTTGGQANDMMKKIMVSYAAGAEIADVCEMNFKLNPMLVKDGIAADTTKYINPYTKYIPKVVLQGATYKGRIYGYPVRGNSTMLLYNKEIFKKAGITEKDISTWEGFVEAGKKVAKLSTPDKKVYMVNVSPQNPGWIWAETMLGQNGIGFFDPKTGKTVVDTDPKAVAAFKLIDEFVKSGIATLVQDMTPPWYAALKEDRIATIVLAGWMTTILPSNIPDAAGKWQIAPYPTFANGKQSMQGAAGFSILTKDPEKQSIIAKALNNTFFKPENAYAYEDAVAFNSSLTFFRDNPPKVPLWDKFFPGQNIKKMDDQLLSNALIHYYTPDYVEALDIVNMELSKAISGEKDIDTAIKDMGKGIRDKIGISRY